MEKLRQAFADRIRRKGRDWSFRWSKDEKVFTDPQVQTEWQNHLRELLSC